MQRWSNKKRSKCDIFSPSTLLEEIHDHYDDKGYKPIMCPGFRNLHSDVRTPQIKPCTSHTHSELQHVLSETHWYLASATEQKFPLAFVTVKAIHPLTPQAARMILSSDHSAHKFQSQLLLNGISCEMVLIQIYAKKMGSP